MGFETDFSAARTRYGASGAARQAFGQLRSLAQRALSDLPTHRALIEQVYRHGFTAKPEASGNEMSRRT
jgi:tryptophan halogenase